MHLSTCSQLDEESRLSQDLVDQIFSLRVNRMLSIGSVPVRAMMMEDEKDKMSQKSNPRYRILWNLRKRVWQKVGWSMPSYEAVQGGLEVDTATQETNEETSSTAASEIPLQYRDESEDSTMMAALDNILLTSDPLDLSQWDDWESITAGFFMA